MNVNGDSDFLLYVLPPFLQEETLEPTYYYVWVCS